VSKINRRGIFLAKSLISVKKGKFNSSKLLLLCKVDEGCNKLIFCYDDFEC